MGGEVEATVITPHFKGKGESSKKRKSYDNEKNADMDDIWTKLYSLMLVPV